MFATMIPSLKDVDGKQMTVRTTLSTPSSLSSSPSSSSTPTSDADDIDIDMDEEYDIITPISLTPYKDDQATDYLNTTYTPVKKVTPSTSMLDFHIAHGPYSI